MKYELVGEKTRKYILSKIKLAKKEFATNVLVVCGGKSFEHDISILTAQIIANADIKKYNIFVLYQSLNGDFYLMPKDLSIKGFKELSQGLKVKLEINSPNILSKSGKTLFRADVAVVCAHGQNCEDGTLAHLFSLCNIASTSFDATSLAITLDKEFMKDVFSASGFKTPPYCVIKSSDFDSLKFTLESNISATNFDEILANKKLPLDTKKIIQTLSKIGFPMIIKPANLGSSIGICTCENIAELISAISFASKFDDKILCEKMLNDFIEINCSARKLNNEIVASRCEEPIKHSSFLSFNDKYLSGRKGGGKSCLKNKNSKIEQKNIKNDEKNAKNEHFNDNFSENLENIIKMTKFLHSENDNIVESAPPLETLKSAYSVLQNIWHEIDQNDSFTLALNKKENNTNDNSNFAQTQTLVKLSEHSVPQCVIDSIQKITCALYKKFDCTSVIRVDFLVTRNYEIFVNEINSIPGSLAYYLWDETISTFIDSLIVSAHKAHCQHSQKSYYFETHL